MTSGTSRPFVFPGTQANSVLVTEPIDEPPKRLAEARTELGLDETDFGVMEIGETRAFNAGTSGSAAGAVGREEVEKVSV